MTTTKLSDKTLSVGCTYHYSHSRRPTICRHSFYANKGGQNLNDSNEPDGYVRLELTKNLHRPLALILLLSRIDLFDFAPTYFLTMDSAYSGWSMVVRVMYDISELIGQIFSLIRLEVSFKAESKESARCCVSLFFVRIRGGMLEFAISMAAKTLFWSNAREIDNISSEINSWLHRSTEERSWRMIIQFLYDTHCLLNQFRIDSIQDFRNADVISYNERRSANPIMNRKYERWTKQVKRESKFRHFNKAVSDPWGQDGRV
jgi:hypothetical protein